MYHCAPKLETTTSGGVDRTTLTLGFEGHQPDIEAMKLLYDQPDELIEADSTQESKGEKGSTLKDSPESIQEFMKNTQETQNSTQETKNGTLETKNSTQETIGITVESTQETDLSNRERLILLLRKNPHLTLAEVSGVIGLTRDGVKKIADKLRTEGVLSRKGSTKAGEWVVNEEYKAKNPGA